MIVVVIIISGERIQSSIGTVDGVDDVEEVVVDVGEGGGMDVGKGEVVSSVGWIGDITGVITQTCSYTIQSATTASL